ncbi:MAG: thioredoxin family protein [Acidobacteriota bacterium]|nr:thioredoxin family protein [Acidobacteriota bacterium]
MGILNTQIRDATRKKLEEGLSGNVRILFFTQEPGRLIVPGRSVVPECMFCRETRQLLEEIQSLSGKIELVVHDFVADKDKADAYGIDKIPAAAVVGEKDHGIRFYGIPSGYEYTSFIESLIDVSTGKTGLSEKTRAALSALGRDIRIQVFVTPTCPYCTMAVRLAHQMALESPKIRAEMVEATEFPHLAQKYGVFGVPKTVINETVAFDGAVPEDVFLQRVLEAAGHKQT